MINFKDLLGFDALFAEVKDEGRDFEQEKRERIDFHRAKVRNGPVSFSAPTNGQLRRAEQRRKAKAIKRNRRREVRNYFATQREGAILRGHLQAVGVLPYGLGSHKKITPHGAQQATEALIRRLFKTDPAAGFQAVRKDGEGTGETLIALALQRALDRWTDIVGLPRTEISA